MTHLPTNGKELYVVLGMARTGTSAITRGLHALGVPLGENLESADVFWNAKGFWEDVDIVYKINRAVMFALDFKPMDACVPMDKAHNAYCKLEGLKKTAIAILIKRLDSASSFGFKDPRTVNILPFWQAIFRDLALDDHYIIALRNPLATAYSYQRVSSCELEVGLLYWLIHLMSAMDGTQGRKRIMVSYELLLENPLKQLERMRLGLNISSPKDASAIKGYVDEFLDKSLQHFAMSNEDLNSHPALQVFPLCMKMYALFERLANDEIAFDSHAYLQSWQAIKDEYLASLPTYRYIESLLDKHKQMERKLRVIHKSLPWKMNYPLRVLDDFLRARRKNRRAKRKLMSHCDV